MVCLLCIFFTVCLLYNFSAPSGPPENFTILTTSRNIKLSWSPPLSSKQNGAILSYFVVCKISGASSSTRTSEKILIIHINPFTNYSCAVHAATMVGDGPPATVSGTSDEDGEYVSIK